MKYRIQLGSIIILAIIAFSLILSQQAGPDLQPFFNLKRLQEQVFLKLQSSPEDKVNYMGSMLEERLQEIQGIINNKSYSYLLSSSLRYSTLAGQITDLLINNNLTDKKEALKNKFLNHQKILDDLYVKYPKNTDNLEYKYLQDGYNYLGLYLEKLEKVK